MANVLLNESATRTNISLAFKRFKKGTGKTQAEVAKELGMGQPALSRYLNGSLPLSRGFIEKFAKAVGVGVNDLEVLYTPSSSIVTVRYLLSGQPISKEVIIMSLEHQNVFGIEVDKPTRGLRKGAVILVSEDVTPNEGDNIVLINEGTILFGVLEFKEDLFDAGWALREDLPDNTAKYHELTKGDQPKYVTGVHYPRAETRAFDL